MGVFCNKPVNTLLMTHFIRETDPTHQLQVTGWISRLKWYCLMVGLLFSAEVLMATTDPQPGLKYPVSAKQKNKRFHQRYLDISGGYGIWSKSWQAGMEPYRAPIDISVTYGKKGYPLALQAGYFFNTSFTQDIFLFKPRNLYVGIKLSILETLGQESRFDPYVIAGVSGWEGILTDNVYDGIITYQQKIERDYGISALIGTGISYQINRFKVGPQFNYFSGGHGYYLAGGFEKQKVSASHMAVILKISYRLHLKNFTGCPTYK